MPEQATANNNTALAPVSEPTVDAAALVAQLGLTDDSPLTLVTTESDPNAATQAAPEGKAKPAATPQKVTIGDRDYTPEQIAERFREIEELAPATEIGRVFYAMTPEQQQATLNFTEQLAQGRNPLVQQTQDKVLTVSPIDVPETAATPVPLQWDDMTPEGQYLYAAISGVHESVNEKLRELSNIVGGMSQVVGQQVQSQQDKNTARALRLQGHTVTAEWVKSVREAGVSNVLAAVKAGLITPPKPEAVVKKDEAVAAPPEPGSTGSARVIDLDNFKGTLQDVATLVTRAGYTVKAKDPSDIESFYRNMGIERPRAKAS